MPRPPRTPNRRSAAVRGSANTAARRTERTDFNAMSTKALRLVLGEHHLQQTGNRRELISRLEAHTLGQRQRPANIPATSNVADTIPRDELAALIASIVEEKMNRPLNQDRQDGQDGGAENTRPSLPPNPRPSTSLSQPLQDGGQPGEQQLAERDRQPGSLPASFLSPSSLYSASNSLDVSDPTHVASLHPDFRQPSLASHLTKATSTAITNGEYVDFASLLPLSSLLTDTINSQLNLKVGDQGLTIPLPSSSKRPKITTIEKWLDAFAIYFAVIVSAHPSRAVDLIAYQQLIRDTARKFPGMAWYVYDVEFRRRASHNLSVRWGERDVQLYLDTFTGLPKSGCRSCGSTDHLSDACPLSHPRSRDALSQSDLCFNFNKGRPCARLPCPYKHRCNQPGCSAAHSGEDHAKLTRHREDRPKSSSSSNNSSRGHS